MTAASALFPKEKRKEHERTDKDGYPPREGMGLKEEGSGQVSAFLWPSFFPRSLGGDAITSQGANCFTHATKGCVEKTTHVSVLV